VAGEPYDSSYSFFFFPVQRCPPLVFFSFSRLLLFYSLSLSLFHLPCPKVFSPSSPFYSSFSPLFLLCSPLFCLLLLLLTVFSAVNNVLPYLQRLRGGAGGRAWLWLGRWSTFLLLLLCVFLLLYSPLFLFYSFASHSVVVDWEASDSW